jgi:hypothetical protein
LLLHQAESVENAENVSEKTLEICTVGRQFFKPLVTLRL